MGVAAERPVPQTVGGRTGVPFPRLTHRSPFLARHSSTAWTTLELILNADGRAEGRLLGASPFPCHSVYGPDGELAAETGVTDFRTWFSTCFGRHTRGADASWSRWPSTSSRRP